MAMTSVDIDLDVLEEAGKVLGTSTKKDTINAALREVLRIQAATRLMDKLESGVLEIDPDDLHRRAWGYPAEDTESPAE